MYGYTHLKIVNLTNIPILKNFLVQLEKLLHLVLNNPLLLYYNHLPSNVYVYAVAYIGGSPPSPRN